MPAPDSWPVAATAIPLGIAFGFILERAGLGDPSVIHGQLVARDFTVVRVMFGAIVTAMLGMLWLAALGVVDVASIAVPPTDVGGQALGAVIFGGGFALASLCPGTACVAAATGQRQGLAAVAGVFLGTAGTPLVWPVVAAASAETPAEGARLSETLGLPISVIAVAVTAVGILAFMVARRIEARQAHGPWWRLTSVEWVALTLAITLAAAERRPLASGPQLVAIAAQIEREEDHVDAIELASWIREGRRGLRIIDVRDVADSTMYTIPGAVAVPLRDIATLEVDPGDDLIVYSDGGAHAAQAWVLLRARGVTNVRVLKDGMAAWEDDVLSPAVPPADDADAQRAFQRVRELSLWFGGQPRLGNGPFERAVRAESPRRRRRTC